MRQVNIGVVGLGTVGGGTLQILGENRPEIARKLGFELRVKAVCDLDVASKSLPAGLGEVTRTMDWRTIATDPEIQIVVELIGGSGVAHELIKAALENGKSVVTANKELIAQSGVGLWRLGEAHGALLAMEASVCGGIPIHNVLREGIAGDSVETLFGILNGTSNYILSEIETKGTPFADVLAEAQRLGYAEANPAADVDGFDARSKLALLASLAFGVELLPGAIFTTGISSVTPQDFAYARQLGCTIKLLCAARRTADGIFVSVRPALIPLSTILAGVHGSYNAVWVKGRFGQDTFYYGRGAGSLPTGVAVVSDLMRVARDLVYSAAGRVSPFAHAELRAAKVLPIERQRRAWYLRFRVVDRPGIIASLATILAKHSINLDAVLQLPAEDKRNLPFVITLEAAEESSVRQALAEMAGLDFMAEPPLAMPLEKGL